MTEKTDDMNRGEVHAKLEEHQRRLDKHEEIMVELFGDIKEIRNKLLGRPGWAVCIIITMLTTFLGIAITIAWQATKLLSHP